MTIGIRKLSSIIQEYGEAHYIEIDVEHFDHLVLYDLLQARIRPHYISVEAQIIDFYCALVAMRYEEFKVQPGPDVPAAFAHSVFQDLNGHSFSHGFSAVRRVLSERTCLETG